MGISVSQLSDQELRAFIQTAMVARTEVVRSAITEFSEADRKAQKRYARSEEIEIALEEIFEEYDDVLRALA